MPESPLTHRAVLPVRATDIDVLAIVRQRTTTWLASKYRDAEPIIESGSYQLNEKASVTLTGAYRPDGGEQGLRIRLRENNPNGLWLTTVTAALDQHPARAWVCVELEHLPKAPLKEAILDRPRLIRELVDSLPVWDGPARFTSRPQMVTPDRIEGLLTVLTHMDRRNPAVVAARPPSPSPGWSRRLKRTVHRVAGSASIYLIDDQHTGDLLRRKLGTNGYGMAPGAIRTYMPEVDPAWPADAHRHRVLSYARIQDPRDQAWKAITRAVQGHAATQPLPEALRETRFSEITESARRDRDQALAQVRAAEPRGDEAELEKLRQEVALLDGLLTEASNEIEQMQEQLLLSERRLESTSDLREQAERALESELTDHLATLDELSQTKDVNVGLYRLLAQTKATPTAQEQPDALASLDHQEIPSTFEELLGMVSQLKGVLFTGDHDVTLELDTMAGSKSAVWTRKTWEALRSLDSYARIQTEEGFSGSFYDFCQRTPDGGRPWSTTNIAMTESLASLKQWGDERIFPVPFEVHPEGKILMEAHMKIDLHKSISPRLYFLDRTSDLGVMVVGFIGKHLTNTKS